MNPKDLIKTSAKPLQEEQLEKNEFLISNALVKWLPKLLRDCISPFSEESHKRDLVFLSSLVTLSACIPKVKGIYDGDETYANLYAMFIAPPASGKGVAKFGTYLASEIQNKLKTENASEQKQYFQKKKEYEQAKKDGKILLYDLNKPSSKSFYIPANTSSAALIKNLKANEELGNLIFDSEVDTLGNVIKNEWANEVSAHLRKAFHHESIGEARKDMDEMVNIDKPKISLLLTGTPNQIRTLFRSYQDGLLSRFLFYSFETSSTFNDVSPTSNSFNYSDFYKKLSNDVLKTYNFFLSEEFTYVLTATEWKYFINKFQLLTNKYSNVFGDEINSFTFRIALIAYRISMILNSLEFSEQGFKESSISNYGQNLKIGIYLAEQLFKHSIKIINTIKDSVKDFHQEDKFMFLNLLPEGNFSNKMINDIAKRVGISERTARREIQKLLKEGIIIKSRHGEYSRSNVNTSENT